MRPSVPRLFIRPTQTLESLADRSRQHETKRRATVRLGWRDAGQPPPALHVVQHILCYTLQQGGV